MDSKKNTTTPLDTLNTTGVGMGRIDITGGIFSLKGWIANATHLDSYANAPIGTVNPQVTVVTAVVCEVNLGDPNNPVPIDGSAHPRLYNVVLQQDKIIVHGDLNWNDPLSYMVSFLIANPTG